MDLLRLEVGPSFQFVPNPLVLRRAAGPRARRRAIYVYFRRGQRRVDAATDGDFCLTRRRDRPAVPGQRGADRHGEAGRRRPCSTRARSSSSRGGCTPTIARPRRRDRVGADWAKRFPGFVPVPGLLVEPDGKTPTIAVRVCREEAQTAGPGTVYVSGRAGAKKGEPLPGGRLTQPPGDSGFARATKGRAVSCLSGTGFQSSLECGCGIGLERCVPGAGRADRAAAFVMPTHTPLGVDAPFEATPQPAAAWERLWWSEEAQHFLDRIFLDDRDFREVLTSRATAVNGPLAQFYRFIASATCCGPGRGPRLQRARAARRARRDPDGARARGHRDVAAGRRSRPARGGDPDDADLPDQVRLAARARARRLQRVPVQGLRRRHASSSRRRPSRI